MSYFITTSSALSALSFIYSRTVFIWVLMFSMSCLIVCSKLDSGVCDYLVSVSCVDLSLRLTFALTACIAFSDNFICGYEL